MRIPLNHQHDRYDSNLRERVKLALAGCIEDLQCDGFFIYYELFAIPVNQLGANMLEQDGWTHESSIVGL
jgi:hypothetical protein